MAVRIRMKRLGRTNRPFYRLCAIDSRTGRDGRVIEELGYYDPLVREVDARAVLKADRVDYWLSVGAQPSDKVRVLIRKYGSKGTHTQAQQEAIERLKTNKPKAPPPRKIALPQPDVAGAQESATEQAGSQESAAETPSE